MDLLLAAEAAVAVAERQKGMELTAVVTPTEAEVAVAEAETEAARRTGVTFVVSDATSWDISPINAPMERMRTIHPLQTIMLSLRVAQQKPLKRHHKCYHKQLSRQHQLAEGMLLWECKEELEVWDSELLGLCQC